MSEIENPDILIIGSGMGGATLAAGLAPSGARILILERGEQLRDTPETRDPRAIFQRGFYRPKETWTDASGELFNPGNYYYVGGNSKFYGAVLMRYRAEDFRPSRMPREPRRAGLSTTTNSSHGMPAPRLFIAYEAPWAAIRPNRRIPRLTRFRRCPTSPRSRRCGRA